LRAVTQTTRRQHLQLSLHCRADRVTRFLRAQILSVPERARPVRAARHAPAGASGVRLSLDYVQEILNDAGGR
jgi:hypothetical protein